MNPILPLPLSFPRFRTVWLSDLHLGTPACRADLLLAFLRAARCDQLYLVGDVIDGLRLRSRWYWQPAHNAVLKEIFHLGRRGVEVTVIPGNHDAFLRSFLELEFENIRLVEETVHQTRGGESLWVIHGDALERRLRVHGLLSWAGDHLYHLLDFTNRHLNAWRGKRRRPHLSLHALSRRLVPAVARYVEEFEHAVCTEASRHGFDGVVCGHIHQARMTGRDGVRYFNTGDWVDSCTALVEHLDGRMELLHLWPDASSAEASRSISHAHGDRGFARG
jgi:UDP-2,3-diacylglucosamine pyrophosphatase LpxH